MMEHCPRNVYIKFTSHRSRDNALRLLADKPLAYFSWKRSSDHGIYAVSDEERELLRQRGARFTKLRGSYSDLGLCWGQS